MKSKNKEHYFNNSLDGFLYNYSSIDQQPIIIRSGLIAFTTYTTLLSFQITPYAFCRMPNERNNYMFNIPKTTFDSLFLQNMNAQRPLIIATDYKATKEIYMLLKFGYKHSNIFLHTHTGKQYFDLSYIIPVENEVFIDAGSYYGDTVIDFIKWCNNKYKKIYCFEPDKINYKRLNHTIQKKNIDRIIMYKNALWNKNEMVDFNNAGNTDSAISLSGKSLVSAVSLDSVIECAPTFIKMDIEGAEYEALVGAERTIRLYKPRLAISVYHNKNDILRIPTLIKSFDPNYKLYLRCYGRGDIDTVLYATL